jgi:hypothetical protein
MRSDNVLNFRATKGERKLSSLRLVPRPVISVGSDPELLRLRHQVITSQSGLTVRSITPEQADPWTTQPEPHLWVFCHTVKVTQLVNLACRVLRFSPESRLVLLEGSERTGFEASLFHVVIRPSDGVEDFLEALATLSIVA